MQKLYDLVYQLSRAIKSRLGYAVTISQAKLAAYLGFLVAMFSVFAAAVQGVYSWLSGLGGGLGGQALLFMPSSGVVAGVLTLYVSALITRKVYDYMHDGWKSWMQNNGM